MFQQNSPEHKHLGSCIHLETSHSQLDSSLRKDNTVRKRLHQLMAQNFQIKQMITKLQNQLQTANQSISEMKAKLKIALQQITANDEIIENFKHNETDQKVIIQQLNNQIQAKNHEIEQERRVVSQLLQHNKNLQTENTLVAEIKHKYQLELTKAKLQLQHFKNQNEKLAIQNQQITAEFNKIQLINEDLQLQIGVRRRQIEEYQTYVLQKISEAKNSTQFHQKCQKDHNKIYCKYLKYKQRSQLLRKERDQLMFHLRQVSREVEGETHRILLTQVK